MDQFYKSWLEQFAENRRRYIAQRGGDDAPQTNTVTQNASQTDTVSQNSQQPQKPSDIIYENSSLKLIVEKSSFKRQKVFRLQDHLFKFKLVHKKPQEELPLLSELFDFLHAALLHVLESVKTFYKKEDHNIAYLTLHQEPMVNGLNTGPK